MTCSVQVEQSQLKAIFFDLDNTLIQTRKADSKACSKISDLLITQYNINNEEANKITSSFLKAFRKCPDNPEIDLNVWRTHLWQDALGPNFDKTDEIYKQWLNLRYHYLALHSDILKLLKSLREHFLLGLVTNGPSHAQWEKIERLELKSYFDCILVSGDLPWEKPSKKIFQEACQYLDVKPKHCIMVGDKLETDIQGGIKAQLGGTIWIPLGTSKPDDMENIIPDYIIENVMQLPSILTNPYTPQIPIPSEHQKGIIPFQNSNDSNIPQLCTPSSRRMS